MIFQLVIIYVTIVAINKCPHIDLLNHYSRLEIEIIDILILRCVSIVELLNDDRYKTHIKMLFSSETSICSFNQRNGDFAYVSINQNMLTQEKFNFCGHF